MLPPQQVPPRHVLCAGDAQAAVLHQLQQVVPYPLPATTRHCGRAPSLDADPRIRARLVDRLEGPRERPEDRRDPARDAGLDAHPARIPTRPPRLAPRPLDREVHRRPPQERHASLLPAPDVHARRGEHAEHAPAAMPARQQRGDIPRGVQRHTLDCEHAVDAARHLHMSPPPRPPTVVRLRAVCRTHAYVAPNSCILARPPAK